MKELDNLINEFGTEKKKLDCLKKKVDTLNKELKEQFVTNNMSTASTDYYKVTYSVTEKVEVNEDKLLEVCKKNGIKDVIVTKEFVDADALEKKVYAGEISQEILAEIGSCSTVKEIPRLLVKAVKGE